MRNLRNVGAITCSRSCHSAAVRGYGSGVMQHPEIVVDVVHRIHRPDHESLQLGHSCILRPSLVFGGNHTKEDHVVLRPAHAHLTERGDPALPGGTGRGSCPGAS